MSSSFRVWFAAEVPALGLAVYTISKADTMIQIFDEPLHEISAMSASASAGAPQVKRTSGLGEIVLLQVVAKVLMCLWS